MKPRHAQEAVPKCSLPIHSDHLPASISNNTGAGIAIQGHHLPATTPCDQQQMEPPLHRCSTCRITNCNKQPPPLTVQSCTHTRSNATSVCLYCQNTALRVTACSGASSASHLVQANTQGTIQQFWLHHIHVLGLQQGLICCHKIQCMPFYATQHQCRQSPVLSR